MRLSSSLHCRHASHIKRSRTNYPTDLSQWSNTTILPRKTPWRCHQMARQRELVSRAETQRDAATSSRHSLPAGDAPGTLIPRSDSCCTLSVNPGCSKLYPYLSRLGLSCIYWNGPNATFTHDTAVRAFAVPRLNAGGNLIFPVPERKEMPMLLHSCKSSQLGPG
jgi:hypothetical protein